jgi:hypothetical protein
MSDAPQGEGWWLESDGQWYPPQQAVTPPPPPSSMHAAPGPLDFAPATGPLGKRESIGLQFLLSVVTLGLYGLYWAYKSHDEIKRHTGEGVGGLIGVLLYAFLGVVSLFLLPIEIKNMYERDGRRSPVGAATAFWILLFAIPWYVKCQAALNEYWAAKGAPAR